MFHKIKNIKGFSILEVVVISGIVTMALVGILAMMSQSSQAGNINKNTFIASTLAQEGLELMRNVRDVDWLSGGSVFDSDDVVAIYFNGTNIVIDDTIVDINSDEAKLYLDGNNFYTHTAGTSTGFSRVVQTTSVSADETKVACLVQWEDRGKTHQYVAYTTFFNWR